jgi:Lipocalin-like domain
MNFNFKLAVLFVSVLALNACKKDEKATDQLTGGCWKHVKEEEQLSGETTWSVLTIDACSADDCTTFAADGKLTIDESAVKCDPSDPQTNTGTWTLSADEKTLTFVYDVFPIPLAGTVVELTANKLVWEFNIGGDKSRTTFTK